MRKETFGGRFEGLGKAEGEISKPINLALGKMRATSISHEPVPAPISAILRVPCCWERPLLIVG